MKKIAVFIFSFVVLASYGKAKMEISNETCLKLNPQMIPCAEKLKDFILLCSNFRLSFSEKNIHAKIEEGNGVYVVRLFEYGTGPESTSTQGCLLLNDNDKLLEDVTLDPIKPIHKNIILSFCHISRCLDFKITP